MRKERELLLNVAFQHSLAVDGLALGRGSFHRGPWQGENVVLREGGASEDEGIESRACEVHLVARTVETAGENQQPHHLRHGGVLGNEEDSLAMRDVWHDLGYQHRRV